MKGRARGRQRQREGVSGWDVMYIATCLSRRDRESGREDGLVLAVASQTKLGTTTPVLFRHACSLEYKVDGDWMHQRD